LSIDADDTLSGQLQVGWPIYTEDGEKIGEVKDVRGRYFNVNATREFDYWLAMDSIASTAGGRVTMSFRKDDLGDVIELRLVNTVR